MARLHPEPAAGERAVPAPEGANATCPPSAEGLLEAVRALNGPMLKERSAKLIGGTLRQGRFLASIPKSALYPGPDRRLKRICGDLGAPSEGYGVLAPHLRAANNVHFGFEPEPGGDLFKCYLEFSPSDAPQAGLVFLALKWAREGTGSRFAVTRYWSRYALSHADKRDLAGAIVPSGPARDAALNLLDLARDVDGAVTFLEVEEPGNARRSIDINLADSGVLLNDLCGQLAPVFDKEGAGDLLDDLLSREGGAKVGHFAAGTARDGAVFITLYFGAKVMS